MAKDKSWDELILQVLTEKGVAMHYNDIANEIVDRKLRSSINATPANTVNSYLRGDKLKDKVTCIRRGFYILNELLDKTPELSAIISDETHFDEDDNDVSDALITAYGRFWDRCLFAENECKLYGSSSRTTNAPGFDFTDCAGIYLLHKGYTVIYVGQAEHLAKRLADHTTDQLKNRWDNFSWFSISPTDSEGDEDDSKKIPNDAILDTLEALLIETLGPERNKKVGNGFEAKEIEQNTAVDFLKKQVKKK